LKVQNQNNDATIFLLLAIHCECRNNVGVPGEERGTPWPL
jgi:hypothetical protein